MSATKLFNLDDPTCCEGGREGGIHLHCMGGTPMYVALYVLPFNVTRKNPSSNDGRGLRISYWGRFPPRGRGDSLCERFGILTCDWSKG